MFHALTIYDILFILFLPIIGFSLISVLFMFFSHLAHSTIYQRLATATERLRGEINYSLSVAVRKGIESLYSSLHTMPITSVNYLTFNKNSPLTREGKWGLIDNLPASHPYKTLEVVEI